MIAVTPDDVALVAPEFKTMAEDVAGGGQAQMESMIDLARTFVNEGVFGTKAKLGISFMTAHMLKELGYGDGASTDANGPVTSEKVGDLQRSYGQLNLANASVGDQLLSTTRYGKMFLYLRRTIVLTPMVT